MKQLRFFKDYLLEKYGHSLQRIAVDAGFSCPNRGKNGEGCLFCAEGGSRAVHLREHMNIAAQIRSGFDFVRRRYDASPPYIAYFQNFTNTFAPVAELEKIYRRVLDSGDFAMLIIATRPDCLGSDVLELLERLNEQYEVIVELGVQTSCDRTLKLIKRGHDFACSAQAAENLASRNIKCAAHMILGLPGESEKDFLQSAGDIGSLPFFAVKMHQLMLLRNSPLARILSDRRLYDSFPDVEFLDDYTYAVQLLKFLQLLPDSWLIMRMRADAEASKIIRPQPQMAKGQFIDYFRRLWDDVQQRGNEALDFAKVPTADGSHTLYSTKYRQHFHSLAGAKSEALHKFIIPAKLSERLVKGPQRLLDIGFGLGYNAIEAALTAEKTAKGQLRIVSLDDDAHIPGLSRWIFPCGSREREIIDALNDTGRWQGQYAAIELVHGDARKTVNVLDGKFDLIFMDGFSPDKNPQLWTFDFVRQLVMRLDQDGLIVSYCSAFCYRGALCRAKLTLGESEPFGRRRPGTVAAFRPGLIDRPIPAKEKAVITQSTAAAAYRDPSLAMSAKDIVALRRRLVVRLRQRGVPKWVKP